MRPPARTFNSDPLSAATIVRALRRSLSPERRTHRRAHLAGMLQKEIVVAAVHVDDVIRPQPRDAGARIGNDSLAEAPAPMMMRGNRTHCAGLPLETTPRHLKDS